MSVELLDIAATHMKVKPFKKSGSPKSVAKSMAALMLRVDPERVKVERCRRHLEPFVEQVFRLLVPRNEFKGNWHIGLICEYLEAVYLGQIRRLIINEPPRFLKSLPVSIAFPAWVLGKQPMERILCASYTAALASEFSLHTRRVIESPWYADIFPETKLASDQNQKTWFETTKRGYRMATSVGGTATGRGGNYKILDDPMDPERAFSAADTLSALRWVDQTWSSRDDSPETTREILVMQRLSINDMTQHFINQGEWELLKIPQETTQRVTYTYPITGKQKVREAGELLHPAYFGPERVAEAKMRLGEYGYAGQHQQEPTAFGGNLVKSQEIMRYDALPPVGDLIELVLSIDTANKEQITNAPTCLGCWCMFSSFPGRYYLNDVITQRWGYPDLKQNVHDYVAMCVSTYGQAPTTILIEDKASGIQLIQDLRFETAYNVEATDPSGEGDKLVRFNAETSAFRAGRVWIPESAPWVFNYVTEITSFPNSPLKDQADMTSQFLKFMRSPREVYVG